jgi:hypothetical protein
VGEFAPQITELIECEPFRSFPPFLHAPKTE